MTNSAYLTTAVSRDDFRELMAQVAGSVAIVTTVHDGVPYGSTVTAFVSLSLDPPMMLVSLGRDSSLLHRLRIGSILGVNVLTSHQASLATQFSRRGIDRFAGVAWRREDGAAALPDVHAWSALSITRTIEAGDHILLIGDVMAARTGNGVPLTYWQRGYGSHCTF